MYQTITKSVQSSMQRNRSMSDAQNERELNGYPGNCRTLHTSRFANNKSITNSFVIPWRQCQQESVVVLLYVSNIHQVSLVVGRAGKSCAFLPRGCPLSMHVHPRQYLPRCRCVRVRNPSGCRRSIRCRSPSLLYLGPLSFRRCCLVSGRTSGVVDWLNVAGIAGGTAGRSRPSKHNRI